MNQHGYIVEIVDSVTAKFKLKRHSACASCGKCATTSEEKDIIVEVDNTIGAKVGDRVEVNMESVNVLKASFIAYTIPLLALLLGTVGTFYFLKMISITNNIEIISGLVGLIFTFISFLILKKNDKKFRDSKEYIPIVTKIIVSSGDEITL
ncbi:SoxR reducing system RseC family protein [Romboutsia ilealis]|uniref:SoxR reducing system RseC family protein n=1 Tax=Romboutsia ilealis TaxID=1115758 RepID=UPI00257250B4|nr:SoxR reducing system RseC family protein [Romboutsia ilealis]